MYSDYWDSNGMGECYRMRYMSFVNEMGVCKLHRFDEDDTGEV